MALQVRPLVLYNVRSIYFASAVAGEDYVPHENTVVHFPAGTRTSCVEVIILDDCILEDIDVVDIAIDYFGNNRVKINRGDGEIRISDSEGVV